ncbi:MAG: hypothetical protein M3O50_04320 [Myxococcota bacterium]|nr:hypothetical protein [Myxococcota bacterium]
MSRGTRRDRVVAWLRRTMASRARRSLWRALGALAIGLGAGFGPQIAPPPPRPPPPIERVVEDNEVLAKK